MAHTRAINLADPLDTQKSGFGARNIIYTETDISERMVLDHEWGSSQDTTLITGDGYHKKITMGDYGAVPVLGAGGIPAVGTCVDFNYDDGSGIIEKHFLDSAGNDIQITQGGYLKVRPVCSVYASVSQIIGPISTKLQLDTEDYDIGGVYDHTAGGGLGYRFTVPAGHTGYYSISASTVVYHVNGVEYAYLYIYKNGAVYKQSFFGINTNVQPHYPLSVNSDIYLVPTDYIEIFLVGDAIRSVTTQIVSRSTSLNIRKIG